MRDILEGVGWLVFGLGAGFFLVTSLASGSTIEIVVSLILVAVVLGGLFFYLRRDRTQPKAPADD